MAEDIVFSVEVDPSGKGAKSLSNLRSEFKQAQKELSNAEVGTDRYNQALQRLGAIRDDIGDLNQTINALNPEGKVQAFANVAGKLAGGFQAATGAAALFGVQSEELEKQLLRVQAATALAQGIQSVVGITDAFKVLGAVIQANPIMFLATAILGIVAATALWIKETDEATAANERLNEQLKTLDENLKITQANEDRAIKQMEASGATQRQIFEERASLAKLTAERAKEVALAQLEILNKANEDEKKAAYDKYIELYLQSVDFDTRAKKASKDLTDFLVNEEKERAKKIKEQRDKDAIEAAKQVSESNKQRIQLEKTYQDTLFALEAMSWEEVILPAKQARAKTEAEIVNQTEKHKRTEAEKTAQIQALLDKKIADNKKLEADRQEQIDQNYFNAVQGLSATYFNFQIAQAQGNAKKQEELRKKQFQVEKAFRAVQATIDTYKAITGTLALGGPLAIPLAVSIGIAGFANVAKILSQQYTGAPQTGGSDVNVGNVNAPQIQTQAPNIGVSTRLNEQGQNLNTQPVRAYVVETDVTESQRRINRLKEQATF